MNKLQLFIAVGYFLLVVVLLFFATTDSKNTFAFLISAVFNALIGTFWVYQFAKGRRNL